MKHLAILLSICVCVACGKGDKDEPKSQPKGEAPAPARAGDKPKAEAPSDRVYPFETAKIVFAYSGFEEGTVEAWIADWGNTIVLVRDMSKPEAKKTTIVWKDEATTMWDDGKKPYTTKIRPKDTELTLVSTNDPKQLEMAGYEKKPNEAVAGQDCEVWNTAKQNVTLYRWNGIDLKYVNGAVGGIVQTVEATSVETGVEVPTFEPPAAE